MSALFVATIVASVLHYVDNLVFFDAYPEPTWLAPHLVDLFWLVMTPIGVVGYVLWRRGARNVGLSALAAYCLMNMLTLGHYRYRIPTEIGFRIHLFIWLEAIAAAGLLCAVLVAARRAPQRP